MPVDEARRPAGETGVPLIWTRSEPRRRQSPLERDDIVRAAMAVADEGGAEALTMSAVAGRLGPYTPMALYRHVLSKDGLVDLMLDAATAEIPLPQASGSGGWPDLRAVAMETWAMAKRHLWYAQLAPTRPPLGPHALRRTEFLLRLLVERGADLGRAVAFAALLDRHVLGSAQQVAEEHAMRRRLGLDTPQRLTEAVTAAQGLAEQGGHELLARWMKAPTGPDMDEQFEISLTFLLDGIEAELSR